MINKEKFAGRQGGELYKSPISLCFHPRTSVECEKAPKICLRGGANASHSFLRKDEIKIKQIFTRWKFIHEKLFALSAFNSSHQVLFELLAHRIWRIDKMLHLQAAGPVSVTPFHKLFKSFLNLLPKFDYGKR